MVKLCQKDNSVVGITAAMPSGTGLKALEKAMPERYYDVGIAEEHAVLFAAGMATMGFHPVVAIYSTFLQRAYDCIIHDVALQDLPVIFCMDRAGLSPQDGPTHHGLFDIAYLRCVPNIIAMAPKDEDEFADMLFTASPRESSLRSSGAPARSGEKCAIRKGAAPTCWRLARRRVVQNFSQSRSAAKRRYLAWETCWAGVARKGRCGQLVAEGFDVAIINPRFTKPTRCRHHGTVRSRGRCGGDP